MPHLWRCPECGQTLTEDAICPACLCETTPDALHKGDSRTAEMLTSDTVPQHLRPIDALMQMNRGIQD